MEHKEALGTNAAERYLLDEMPPEERDAFEEHYFDCSECAYDVRSGAQLVAGTRAEGKAKVVDIRKRRPWWVRMPQVAAASLLFASLGWVGGANFAGRAAPVVREIRQVDLVETERAAESAVVIPHGQHATLNFDLPRHDDAASYIYSLRDADAKSEALFSGKRTAAEAADPVHLSLPALPRGSYRVVIEGVREDGNRFSISSMHFEVGERTRGQ